MFKQLRQDESRRLYVISTHGSRFLKVILTNGHRDSKMHWCELSRNILVKIFSIWDSVCSNSTFTSKANTMETGSRDYTIRFRKAVYVNLTSRIVHPYHMVPICLLPHCPLCHIVPICQLLHFPHPLILTLPICPLPQIPSTRPDCYAGYKRITSLYM